MSVKGVIQWFGQSHRWQHAAGGVLIGLGAIGWYCAAYAGIGIASALEYKDKAWGGKWDWIDWILTIFGVAIGYLINYLIR